MRSWSQGHRAKNEIIAASSEYSGQENKVLAYVCIWEQGLQTSRQNSLYNQHMWRDAPVTSCLITLNSELLYKLNFSPLPSLLLLILLKVGWNPWICPARSWDAGSHISRVLAFPLPVPLSFTLSRRMTSLYIIERGAHAPTSVTALASPARAAWSAEVVINHTLLNWAWHSDQWSDWGVTLDSSLSSKANSISRGRWN